MSDLKWRLLDTGPGNACYNMALDEAIARTAIVNCSGPVLRIYKWDRPSVTLGRFQKASDLDIEFCSLMDIPFVRRPTGGRAIIHGEELTYSFSASTQDTTFAGGLFSSYALLSDAFVRAFQFLGFDAKTVVRKTSAQGERTPLCFNSTSFGEITIRDRKVIGSAQRRWPGGMLQQGSIPLKFPNQKTYKVFINARHNTESLIGLRDFNPAVTYDSLKNAILAGFRESLGVAFKEEMPSSEELDLASQLNNEKYQKQEWNRLK